VYFLYEYNRVKEAASWFNYLGTKYPDKTILDNDTNSFPRNVTLDDYAVARFQGDAGETDRKRVQAGIEGLLVNSYTSLAVDQEQGDDRFGGYRLMAQRLWNTYMTKIPKERTEPIALPPFQDTDRKILDQMLDPQTGFSPEFRAVLRSKLGMGKESGAPVAKEPDRAAARQP
jgi:hypothetical protein